ncbi:MAG: peptidoglycan DD-metalloendopeptidase family protein [Alphaproteobacteria bacterium]|nr:peptidoglycan DD-metalloendopeptidase family protein [Alphaproteobacteria bacterium]MDD9920170.1 peptidoglycan DD-metalloendopeptidase family protein [Alphaproteobacteria bacterium]
MKNKIIIALGVSLIVSACSTQNPAPVISGYTRMPWEPKLREVETPAPVQQAMGQQSQVSEAQSYTLTGVRTPQVTESMDLNLIEPAAGPSTVTSQRQAPVAGVAANPQMTTHVVQQGETLYSISTKYGKRIAEVMGANSLVSGSVQAGDILLIPNTAQATTQAKVIAAPVVQPVQAQKPQLYSLTRARFAKQQQPVQQVVQTQPQMVAVTQQKPAVQQGRVAAPIQNIGSIEPAAGAVNPTAAATEVTYVAHNVQAGETLYRIGRKYGVTPIDLMAANNFEKPQDLKAGMTLRVPVQGVQRAAQRQVNQRLAQAKGMVWPARGKVLNSYGNKGNGVTHTGINIQLPENTPVVAAESGTVIYSDEGLKSYGKLVLLRHSGGLVTAYAHNNELRVQKNQKVQKGEVIALSGSTGQVTFPQLHFEVRRNAQAINPLSVLPKN